MSYISLIFSIHEYTHTHTHTTGQQLGFGQEDYTQTENTGSVSIEVTKLGGNVDPIVVNIMALTFDEFATTPGAVLPPELVVIVDDVDPAECKLSPLFLILSFSSSLVFLSLFFPLSLPPLSFLSPMSFSLSLK